jgi:hypothetical protein
VVSEVRLSPADLVEYVIEKAGSCQNVPGDVLCASFIEILLEGGLKVVLEGSVVPNGQVLGPCEAAATRLSAIWRGGGALLSGNE